VRLQTWKEGSLSCIRLVSASSAAETKRHITCLIVNNAQHALVHL